MSPDLIRWLQGMPRSPARPPAPARLGPGLRTDPVDPDDPLARQPADVQRLIAELARDRSARPILTHEPTATGVLLHLWENAGDGLITCRSVEVPAASPPPPPAPVQADGGGRVRSGLAFLLVGAGLVCGTWYAGELTRPPTISQPAPPDYRAEIDTLAKEVRSRREVPAPTSPPAATLTGQLEFTLVPKMVDPVTNFVVVVLVPRTKSNPKPDQAAGIPAAPPPPTRE